MVLFDQRNCGRSLPHASDPGTDLANNTLPRLVADMEALRRELNIESWLLLGGSWGSTLALAYAVSHPERVSEMVLFGVIAGRHAEFDWTFRGGLSRFFPEQWERLLAFVPDSERGDDIVEAYHRLVNAADVDLARAAAQSWCLWESATPGWPSSTVLQPRFQDERYALAFARIVTHYIRHNAWLDDGELLRDATALAETPTVLINGRFDFQTPIGNAWALKRALPLADLVIVADTGHSPTDAMSAEIVGSTDRFAVGR